MPYPEFQPMRPVSALIGGIEAGQKVAGTALDLQEKQRTVQQHKARQSALQEYVKTGDMSTVILADPEFGLKLQAELRKMNSEDRKDRLDAMNKSADFLTKALPFLNPQTWPAFVQDASQFPLLRSMIPQNYDPRWHEAAKKGVLDVKTAAATIAGEYRLAAEKTRGEYGLRGREMTGEYGLARERLRGRIGREKLTDYGGFRENYRREQYDKTGAYPSEEETRKAWKASAPKSEKVYSDDELRKQSRDEAHKLSWTNTKFQTMPDAEKAKWVDEQADRIYQKKKADQSASRESGGGSLYDRAVAEKKRREQEREGK